MATIQSTLALQDKMSPTFRAINTAMGSTLNAMRSIKGIELGPEFARAAADIRLAERALESFDNDMNNFGQNANKNTRSVGDGFTVMKGLAVEALSQIISKGFEMGQQFLNYSENMSGTTARLNNMNDGLATTDELQKKIFESSQRTRTSYNDTLDIVAKLGTNASKAFGNNEEIVMFAEQMNKQFKIGGASLQEQSSAMYQLTQAMSSGKLQGDEYKVIIENAPLLAQSIEKFVQANGHAELSLKEMSSQGLITSDIVKSALFSIAETTNAKFAEIPISLSQSMTLASNTFSFAFADMAIAFNQSIATMINGGMVWLQQNIDTVATGIVVLGIIALAVASAFAVAWLVANWPIALIIASIGMFVAMLGQMGVTTTEVITFLGGLFGWLYGIIFNVFGLAWNLIATFVEFFANVFNDPIGAIGRLFFDLFDTVLGIIENVAGAIDALFGTNMAQGINNFSSQMQKLSDSKFGENKIKIERMDLKSIPETTKNMMAGATEFGAKIQSGIDKFKGLESPINTSSVDVVIPPDLMANTGGGKALKTKQTDKLKIEDEDLKMLLDIATRDYSLNYKQVSPEITMNFGDINQGADANNIISQLADAITELSTSNLEVTPA